MKGHNLSKKKMVTKYFDEEEIETINAEEDEGETGEDEDLLGESEDIIEEEEDFE